MTRDPLLYLQDIGESIEKIQRYVANLSFGEFVSNDMVIDAVIFSEVFFDSLREEMKICV